MTKPCRLATPLARLTYKVLNLCFGRTGDSLQGVTACTCLTAKHPNAIAVAILLCNEQCRSPALRKATCQVGRIKSVKPTCGKLRRLLSMQRCLLLHPCLPFQKKLLSADCSGV